MAYWTAPGRALEGSQDSSHDRSSSPQRSHERMHAWLVGPNPSVGDSWKDAHTVSEDRADRPRMLGCVSVVDRSPRLQ